jgi:hypothetical protein
VWTAERIIQIEAFRCGRLDTAAIAFLLESSGKPIVIAAFRDDVIALEGLL